MTWLRRAYDVLTLLPIIAWTIVLSALDRFHPWGKQSKR